MIEPSVSELERRLGHRFRDAELLRRALSHRSFCAENAGHASNERLEFLGDAVLGVVVTDRIFRDYPDLPEGELAKVRAAVVSAETLAAVAAELGLGEHLLLGRGEEQSGGREKNSILADAMEAVIGAVFLDGGMPTATALVLRVLGARVAESAKGPGVHDYKTRLQELAVRLLDEVPRYEVVDAGPDHAKEFHARVFLAGAERGSGDGTSKKQAEQEAAAEAWDWLRGRLPDAADEALAAESAGSGAESDPSDDATGDLDDTAPTGGGGSGPGRTEEDAMSERAGRA